MFRVLGVRPLYKERQVCTMKLKETLAENANKAQTEEEIKATIEDAGMELSEDELDEVSGGKNYDIKVMIL